MTLAAAWRGLALAGVAALILAWLAATAWVRPLMLPDEGRYVGVAWEMLRSGDWLTPTLDGLPYFHKPPLFYWITAGALALFGPNEWAARAAPIFGAGLGALSIYVFAQRWWGERAARLGVLALLVQPLYFIGGQFANLDMLVAGCITATILLLAHAAMCAERGLPYRNALAGAYAMAAAGVLAKGLIGFVIPALVVGAWLLWRRRWRVLMALLWWPGVAIFVGLAAPWFVAMQWRFGDFLDYFFVVQHFRRFAAGGFNNVQPWWFFPAVLLLFSLPWLPWLAGPFRRGFLREADRGSEPGLGPGREPEPEPEPAPAPCAIRPLLVLWVVIVVVFFSLPQSKLLGYILPAVPPLALLMADGYAMALAARPVPGPIARPNARLIRAMRLWQASVAITAITSLGALAAIAMHPVRSSRDFAFVLADRRGVHEPVVMLGNYYFDLPFYARVGGPVDVVDDWTSAEVGQRDNWRKELADAGRFAPERAASVLIEPASLGARLCASPVSWVIGASKEDLRFPFLAGAQVVLARRETTLWRVDRALPSVASALRCAGTPSGGPADR